MRRLSRASNAREDGLAMTSVGLPSGGLTSVGLPSFPGARQPRPIRTFVQGGALAAAISLSPACGLGFRRPTQHLKQMASAVNRVSEARFPAQTLKQRAAGGHQSSWCAAAEMELGRGA